MQKHVAAAIYDVRLKVPELLTPSPESPPVVAESAQVAAQSAQVAAKSAQFAAQSDQVAAQSAQVLAMAVKLAAKSDKLAAKSDKLAAKTEELHRTKQSLSRALYAAGVVNARTLLGGSIIATALNACWDPVVPWAAFLLLDKQSAAVTVLVSRTATTAEYVVMQWEEELFCSVGRVKRHKVFKAGLRKRKELVKCLRRDVPTWVHAGMDEEQMGECVGRGRW